MIDVLFVAYNRLAYTVESFNALAENTNWDLVDRLYILDDGSTDGTLQWLQEARAQIPVLVTLEHRSRRDDPRHEVVHGPVAATNWYLEQAWADGRVDTDMVAKIDNDFVVCPYWLDHLNDVLRLAPELDILGIEPFGGTPTLHTTAVRRYRECTHIGGKGLMRLRAFRRSRPTPSGVNGYFGFTEWQQLSWWVTKGWLDPELPVFGLDQLPFDPWRSLAAKYESNGWARRWPEYASDGDAYWQWWLDQNPERRAA